jgi:hypothetical protein
MLVARVGPAGVWVGFPSFGFSLVPLCLGGEMRFSSGLRWAGWRDMIGWGWSNLAALWPGRTALRSPKIPHPKTPHYDRHEPRGLRVAFRQFVTR